MKAMMKDAAILFLITLIAGCLLGVVYDVTKDPIAAQQAKAKNEACKNVFEAADSFEAYADFDSDTAASLMEEEGYDASIDEVMTAVDGAGNILGYVVTVTDHEGYGGDIQYSMGITLDGNVNGISLLSISETAGLGMRADEVLVPQFVDKAVDQFVYTKSGASADNEIDAISGATITTNAVVNGANAALCYYKEVLMEGGN